VDGENVSKETTRVTAPVASSTPGVNVFAAPGKAISALGSQPVVVDVRVSAAIIRIMRDGRPDS
jgi:hypothetical protein